MFDEFEILVKGNRWLVFTPSSDHSRCLQAIPQVKVHARDYKTDPKRIALNRRLDLSPQSETQCACRRNISFPSAPEGARLAVSVWKA